MRWPCSESARGRREGKEGAFISQSTDINLPFICADTIRRRALADDDHPCRIQRLVDHLMSGTPRARHQSPGDAKLKPVWDEVVLVGDRPVFQSPGTRSQDVRQRRTRGQPDEVVAVGDDPGAIIGGDVKDVVLLDDAAVTGDRDGGGRDDGSRRTRHHHPDRKRDLQHGCRQSDCRHRKVFQGERKMAMTIGCWDNSATASRRRPELAPNQVIQHRRQWDPQRPAKDLGTGKEQAVKISSQSGCEAEIEDEKGCRCACGRRSTKRKLAEAEPGTQPDLSDRKAAKEHADKLVLDRSRRSKPLSPR